jgi:hypothetical protein
LDAAITVSNVDQKSVKVQVDPDEACDIYVLVTTASNPSVATIMADGKKYASNGAAINKKITMGDTEGSEDYNVYVVLVDDEEDVYANPDPSMWIFTDTGDGIDRIRDILPAPNTSARLAGPSFTTCDDDAPYVIAKDPEHLSVQVGLNDNVYITFNEDILYTNAVDAFVKLRKAANNVQVPATVSVVDGDSIEINPGITLTEETSYYVEIDRYAITDDGNCGANDALIEWVGKDDLFFTTVDETAPVIDSTNTWPTFTTCVDPVTYNQVVAWVTEYNDIEVNMSSNANVLIYRGGGSYGTLLEVIPVKSGLLSTGVVDDVKALLIDVSGFVFLGEQEYYIEIPAGAIKDEFGNETAAPFGWSFTTLDNVAPEVTWEIHSLNSWFNNSDPSEVGINSAWSLADNGVAGETSKTVSSHSILKVDFGENVQINTRTASNPYWVALSAANWTAVPGTEKNNDGTLSSLEIFKVLDIDGLVYDKDVTKTDMVVLEVTNSTIVVGFKLVSSALYNEATLQAGSTAFEYGSAIDEASSLDLESASYDVTLANTMIADMPSCSNTPNMVAGADVVTIVTRDDTPPTLDMSVCDADCNIKNGEIILSFSKPVVKSSYDIVWLDHESETADNLILNAANMNDVNYFELIRVSNGSNVGVKDVVIEDMQTIRFKPASNLKSDEDYKIVFNKWTVKEFIENDPSGTLFEGDSCTFHVADYMAPVVSGLTPADNSTNLSSNITQIQVTFDEKIMKGSGVVKIRRENGQVFAELDVNDPKVTITPATTKNVLTIDFSALQSSLEDFTMFYVEMPAGFVTDTVVTCGAPNAFGGFAAALDGAGKLVSADWDFATADQTPPELASNIEGDVTGLWPVSGDVNVPKNSNLVMTFDENITLTTTASAGLVIYHDNGDDTDVDFGNAIEFIPWDSPRITISGSDIYNGLTSDVVTVDPVTTFETLGTYYVRVGGDNIFDMAVVPNAWTASTNVALDEITDEEWHFVITNDVAPVLVATTPDYDGVAAPGTYVVVEDKNGAKEGSVTADLSMTFEDGAGNPLDVVKGDNARFVRIYEYVYNPATLEWNDRLWKEMPITDESITISGNVVTINDVVLRDGIKGDSVYYVTVDPGAILNGYPGSQTFWAGISNGFRWRFQTAADDVFVAGYDIISPNAVEDGEDGRNLTIADASTLEIGFNEGIEALDAPTGMVKVYDAVADTLVEAVTVTAAMCADTVLTVPLTKLFDETTFYVVIEAGSLADTSTVATPNNEVGGVDVWTFHTGDNTAPVPVAVSPADADMCVASNVTFTVTYDETNGVTANAGDVVITDADDVVVATVAIDDITVEGNTVTFAVAGLPDTTALTVTLPAGLVMDGDAHSPLPSNDYTWTFTTGENTAPVVAEITPVSAVTADTVLTVVFSEVVNAATLEGVVTVNGEEVTVTSVDGITYTGALTALMSETTYTVAIADGAFEDVNAGCTANPIAATELTFEVQDILAPMAVTYSPATADDYKDLELVIVFDDAVKAAAGDVVVYDAATDAVVATIAAADFASTNDTTYTYTTNDLYYGSFYVMIDAGSFVDAAAAPGATDYAGIADATTWTIDIVDNEFCANYTILNPADGAVDVATEVELQIQFDCERIVPGDASAFITVAKQSNTSTDAAVETAVEESMISVVDGKYVVTITASGLEEMTTYSVIIAPGAVKDEAGNNFPGIIDANTWNFTTLDATAPVVTLVAGTVTNVDGTATMSRDEVGPVYLVNADVAADIDAITSAVLANKAVVGYVAVAGTTVDVSAAGLVAGNYRAVAIDESGNVGESTEVLVVEEVVIPPVVIVPIKDVQGSADASPLLDQVVTIQGNVTTVDGNGYYVQDANAAWSGIYVYDKDNVVSVGGAIKVTGKVAEWKGLTEIVDVSEIEAVLPTFSVEPITIAAADALSEMYEGVRVTIEGTVAEGAVIADKYGNFDIVSASDVTYTVGLYAYVPETYTTETNYNYKVTGVVWQGDGGFKINPHEASDITNWSRFNTAIDYANAIRVYPNPFEDEITINVATSIDVTKAVITNIAGQTVMDIAYPNGTVNTSDLRSGVYFISLHTEEGIAKAQRIIKR